MITRRRALAIAIVALLASAVLGSITGGFTTRALGFKISFRSPLRPLLVSALFLVGYFVTFGWRSLVAELTWLSGGGRPGAPSGYRRGLWLIAIVFVGIVASYRDFIPYWDAKSYFNCIADATQKPFDLLNFRCVGHPSIAYLFLLGFTQYLVPWNVSLAYAINALLGVASIVAFHALLGLLFPRRPAAEYALVTALYAFAPLLVAHAIFLNVDYGMTAFYVLFVYCLFARRFWSASLFAVTMMFSKEIGAAAYAVTVAAYVVTFTLRAPTTWKERAGELRLQAPLMAAPFALAMYVVLFHMLQSNPGPWLASYAPVGVIQDRLDSILNTNLADASVRSYLADIFILNYQWVYSGVVAAALCAAVVRTADPPVERVARAGIGLFLFLVILGLVYSVTRYRPFNNARYVLIISPVLIVAFYYALLSVVRHGVTRRMVLSVAAVLVFLSNFRTLDAGSKYVFGTFNFGSHALLDMPSLMGGLKLDSIVYNLESLQFHYLFNDMMQDVRPAPHAVFFMGDTSYNFPAHVDARSYALTLDPSHALPLSILSGDGDVQRDVLRKHVTGDGDRFFYMAFANADNHQLRLLLEQYPLVATKQYERHGYTLDVYTLRFTSMR
jgi:hypothetical protein